MAHHSKRKKRHAFADGSVVYCGDTPYVITESLSSGSCGDVYRCTDLKNIKPLALKHLYGDYATDYRAYYRNTVKLCSITPPHKALCFPDTVGKLTPSGSFVYTMPLMGDQISFARLINQPTMLTMDQKLELTRQIAEAFDAMEKQKMLYPDPSAKNFLYKLEVNGTVSATIIDCDAIITEGNRSFGILGTGKFRAPRVLLGAPPTFSDARHACAAVLFHMLTGSNPLDGKRAQSENETPASVERHWGKDPAFIFGDDTPNPCTEPDVIARWNQLPASVQLFFKLMFSRQNLRDGSNRPTFDVLLKLMQMA